MVSWIPKHRCICRQCVLSASMRLCEESVICKVASIDSLNSKQVSLWIFTSGRLNLFFFIFDWNPVIHFLVTILVVFSWWSTVILSGFVYSFTLAGSNVNSLFDFLVSNQCKQLFLFCDQLVSSINGLRIVCLCRTAFWLSVFWVRGIQEFKFAYKFNHPLKIDNIN